VLSGLSVQVYEEAQALIARNSFAMAARELELAAAIRPDAPGLLFEIASIYARDRNKGRALEWLNRAVAKGFKDGARVERDPAFTFLRGEEEFESVRRRLGSGKDPG